MSKIRIASLQLKVLKDKYDSIEQLAELIAGGAADGADIISLPEMWNCPYDTELFPEEFEAWANGPVCRDLFTQTRGQFSVTEDDEPGDISNLTAEQKETIDSVLDYYFPHNAQWLSELTHLEDPWQLAREGIPAGVGSTNIITKESMAMYYGSL